MLVEEIRDLWICSCGSWVGQAFSWCPDCLEDREEEEGLLSETQFGRAN